MGLGRIVTALGISIVLVGVSGPANAHWSPPVPLEEPGWWTTQATIAVARDGQAVAAWVSERADGGSWIRYRKIGRDGKPGPVHTLGDPSVSDSPAHLQVAVDDDADALFTWSTPSNQSSAVWSVMAQRVSRAGSVGPRLQLSDSSRSSWNPSAAVTPTGGGLVAYDEYLADQGRWRRVLVRVSTTSAHGKRWNLAAGPPGAPVKATRAGDFVTAGGSSDGVITAYRLRPNNSLRSRRISANTPGSGWAVSVGIGRHGTAYFAFIETRNGRTALWARRWKPGGALSSARRISPRAHDPVNVLVSVDEQGDAVITWPTAVKPGDPVMAYARTWRRYGSLARVRQLGPSVGWSTTLSPPGAPQVAVDRDGDGVIAWSSTKSDGNDVTWGRRIHRNGTVGRRFVMRDNAAAGFVGVTRGGAARVGLLYLNDGVWMRSGP